MALCIAIGVGAGGATPVFAAPATGGTPTGSAETGPVAGPVTSLEQAHQVYARWTPEKMRAARDITTVPVPYTAIAAAATQPAATGPARQVGGAPPKNSGQVAGPSTLTKVMPYDLAYPYPYTAYDVPAASTTRWPYSTVGVLFFTEQSGAPGRCSGTAVVSHNRSTVDTAGHCVYDTDTHTWNTNFMFCPAYVGGALNGTCPLGQWVAIQPYTTREWQNNQYEFDYGEVSMWFNGQGALTDIVGSAGVAWNQNRNQNFQALGWPAAPPFSGGQLHECDAPYATSENPDGILGISPPDTFGIGCDTSLGASGGPLFFGFNSRSSGWVNGHFSYFHPTRPHGWFSPYYGDAAYNLWVAASA